MHASEVNVIILNVESIILGWTRLLVLSVRLSGLGREREIIKISRPRSLINASPISAFPPVNFLFLVILVFSHVYDSIEGRTSQSCFPG